MRIFLTEIIEQNLTTSLDIIQKTLEPLNYNGSYTSKLSIKVSTK